MKYTSLLFSLIFLTLFTTGVPIAHAEVRQINEDQAMTAFVANVARYVSWPAQQGDTVVIGILGKGNLSREWQSLSGRIINGRRCNVIKSADTYDMIDCHIVVIEETNASRLSRSLLVLRRHPIITISSSSDFTATGSTINVALTNNRITFAVNLGQARSVGLDISSNLLKLATEVIR
jgi:hypothetical protein